MDGSATIDLVGDGEPGRSGYWIDGPGGCPIGGPFDLWRANYFRANGEPPEDTAKMYPSLSAQTVADVAVATVTNGATLDEVLSTFGDRGPEVELMVAHHYFSEWHKRVPFMPDSAQDLPLRPARTTPEPLDEFLKDWREHHSHARDCLSIPEEQEIDSVDNPVVFFQRPDNWDSMTNEEQDEFCLQLAEQMGLPD